MYLDNVSHLEALIGPELMFGMFEWAIWTDRLFTLARLQLQLGEGAEPTAALTVEATRDQQTLFFLACGCLRELAKSFRSLLASGIEGLVRAADDRHLVTELKALLGRWAARTLARTSEIARRAPTATGVSGSRTSS